MGCRRWWPTIGGKRPATASANDDVERRATLAGPRPPRAPAAWPEADSANLTTFGLLFVVAILPVLLTPIPAMIDYPNHLARMYLLARDGTPDAQPLYGVAWALYPNLAMDLLVPWIGRLIGVEPAMRLFLLCALLLVVSGAVAIERVVKGRFQFAGYLALLALYSFPFALGFLNFEFALGLALWGIAAWLARRDDGWLPRIALHAAFVALLFVAHLFALGVYGATLGLHELWLVGTHRRPVRQVLIGFAALAFPAIVVFAVMVWTGGSVGQGGITWSPETKLFWLVTCLSGYSVSLSALGIALLVVAARALWRWNALRVEASGAWLMAGLGALYLAMPFRLFDTAFVDVRVIVAMLLIVPAFVTLSVPSGWRRTVATAFIGFMLADIGVVGWTWLSYQRDYRAMIASFALMGKGARLLVGHSGQGLDPPRDLTDYPIYHAPTLAVHYADAFVPTLFTSVGKQPLVAREPNVRLALPYGGPVPTTVLKAIANSPEALDVPVFMRTWRRDYGYLCVVGPPAPNIMPDILEPLAAGTRFTLYRIRKTADPGP